MKVTRVIILGVALIAGVSAAWLAMNLSAPAPAPAPTPVANGPQIDTVDVLVATRDIPVGTTLKDDAFAWKVWPKAGISPSYITRAARPEAAKELIGTIARGTFFQGEPLSDAKLVTTDRGYMSAILPSGKRAIATRISVDTSAGGFILPNDRVDVIMTRQMAAAGTQDQKFVTETILNNIRVLAIDQTVEDQDGKKVVVGQTATLELTPQQAEIMTVAQQMSERLTLALRSLSDADVDVSQTNPDAIHLIGGADRRGGVTVVRNGVSREVLTAR